MEVRPAVGSLVPGSIPQHPVAPVALQLRQLVIPHVVSCRAVGSIEARVRGAREAAHICGISVMATKQAQRENSTFNHQKRPNRVIFQNGELEWSIFFFSFFFCPLPVRRHRAKRKQPIVSFEHVVILVFGVHAVGLEVLLVQRQRLSRVRWIRSRHSALPSTRLFPAWNKCHWR